MKLDDGTAEMEWLSATSFRFARSWTGPVASLPKITHEAISPEFDEAGSTITMRTRLLAVVLDRGDLSLQVRSRQNAAVATTTMVRGANGVAMRVALRPDEKFSGCWEEPRAD